MSYARRSAASRRSLVVLLASSALLAAACGGGGGGGGQVAQGLVTLGIEFPPGAACLTTEPTLTVRGTATNGALVADLAANGVRATSTDGFATWIAAAPVPLTSNVVRVEGTDRLGRPIGPQNVAVEVAALPTSVSRLAFDPTRRQLLCGTSLGNPLGLIALDVDDARFVVVSGPARGAGPALSTFLEGAVVDAATDLAYVIGFGATAVWEIALATGDRRIVSDKNSSGVAFKFPQDVDLDDARSRLVVSDRDLKAILAVDITTGARTILSDATHGSGVALASPVAIQLVAGLDRLLVVDTNRLLAVDLADGDRSVVSDATHGAGPAFQRLGEVTLDPVSGDAIANDSLLSAVLRVDLATGDRAIVSDATTGSGPAIVGGTGVTMLEAADGRAALLDGARNGVLAVDLATGDREELQTLRIGGGERLGVVRDLVFDPASDRLFAARATFADVIAIDARTGDRSLVSGAARGAGQALVDPVEIGVAPSTGQLVVIEGNDDVLAVDLATGNRTLLSGSGPALQTVEDLVDDARRRALVSDAAFGGGDAAIVAVDLITGDRSELSGPGRGAGPALLFPDGIALSADGRAAFVVDIALQALVRVDAVTGDRSIVSDATHGSGPALRGDSGLALTPDGKKAFAGVDIFDVMEIDLATGDRVLVAGTTIGHGPSIGDELFFDPARGALLGQTRGRTALIAIDPVSGDRAAISY